MIAPPIRSNDFGLPWTALPATEAAETPDPKTRLTARLLTLILHIPAIDAMVDTMLLSMQLSERTRTANPEIGRAYTARFGSYRRKPFIQAVDSVLVRRDVFLDKLREVATPALVLSGADDMILPTAMNRGSRIACLMPRRSRSRAPRISCQ